MHEQIIIILMLNQLKEYYASTTHIQMLLSIIINQDIRKLLHNPYVRITKSQLLLSFHNQLIRLIFSLFSGVDVNEVLFFAGLVNPSGYIVACSKPDFMACDNKFQFVDGTLWNIPNGTNVNRIVAKGNVAPCFVINSINNLIETTGCDHISYPTVCECPGTSQE